MATNDPILDGRIETLTLDEIDYVFYNTPFVISGTFSGTRVTDTLKIYINDELIGEIFAESEVIDTVFSFEYTYEGPTEDDIIDITVKGYYGNVLNVEETISVSYYGHEGVLLDSISGIQPNIPFYVTGIIEEPIRGNRLALFINDEFVKRIDAKTGVLNKDFSFRHTYNDYSPNGIKITVKSFLDEEILSEDNIYVNYNTSLFWDINYAYNLLKSSIERDFDVESYNFETKTGDGLHSLIDKIDPDMDSDTYSFYDGGTTNSHNDNYIASDSGVVREITESYTLVSSNNSEGYLKANVLLHGDFSISINYDSLSENENVFSLLDVDNQLICKMSFLGMFQAYFRWVVNETLFTKPAMKPIAYERIGDKLNIIFLRTDNAEISFTTDITTDDVYFAWFGSGQKKYHNLSIQSLNSSSQRNYSLQEGIEAAIDRLTNILTEKGLSLTGNEGLISLIQSLDAETKTCSIRIIWNDYDNRYNYRPDAISATLQKLRNGNRDDITSILLNENNNWTTNINISNNLFTEEDTLVWDIEFISDNPYSDRYYRSPIYEAINDDSANVIVTINIIRRPPPPPPSDPILDDEPPSIDDEPPSIDDEVYE